MLKNVCKSIKKWEVMGLNPVTVSVNFSKVHLSNTNFVSQIKRVIDSYGISPKYIEIEFTETLDVENYNSLVRVNRELKQCGLKTSIDDFGAGFSSLNMLKDVPVDVVKLDKSLIDDTNSSTREKIIIQDIVKMAKTLDIEVIAEGVEELDQLVFLKNINCTQIQGYIFDKPLSLDEFEKRLTHSTYYKDNPKFKDVVHNNNSSNSKISSMNFGKYTLDLNNYKILDCNDSFCNIVGYSKDEIINNDFTIENFIVYEEVADYLDRIVSNLIANGEVCQEHKMIRKNGNKIYVMCLGVIKSSGQAEFMVSDISINKVVERENNVLRSNFDFAQKELKNKNYMFEQIVNTLSGGIGVFALQKDDTVKTVFASNSFYNVIKCKRSIFDRYKNNILELLVPTQVEEFLQDLKECIEHNKLILKRYTFKSIQNVDESNTLNLKMQSTGSSYEDCPTVNIVVASYNIGNVEMELINEIAKVSLLTEYSNLDMIPLQKDSLDID
jgi:PAS domain S-box-containing protein